MGSDLRQSGMRWFCRVSIRAPAWGATRCFLAWINRRTCFNSRSRVGSDHARFHQPRPCLVSIRAPAWGATCFRVIRHPASRFQFALPRGERPVALPDTAFSGTFQFALPRGERRCGITHRNPNGCVSIRAPAWGATRRAEIESDKAIVSIRAPAWGATPCGSGRRPTNSFQFALPRGERH